jgi:hypothetical protein
LSVKSPIFSCFFTVFFFFRPDVLCTSTRKRGMGCGSSTPASAGASAPAPSPAAPSALSAGASLPRQGFPELGEQEKANGLLAASAPAEAPAAAVAPVPLPPSSDLHSRCRTLLAPWVLALRLASRASGGDTRQGALEADIALASRDDSGIAGVRDGISEAGVLEAIQQLLDAQVDARVCMAEQQQDCDSLRLQLEELAKATRGAGRSSSSSSETSPEGDRGLSEGSRTQVAAVSAAVAQVGKPSAEARGGAGAPPSSSASSSAAPGKAVGAWAGGGSVPPPLPPPLSQPSSALQQGLSAPPVAPQGAPQQAMLAASGKTASSAAPPAHAAPPPASSSASALAVPPPPPPQPVLSPPPRNAPPPRVDTESPTMPWSASLSRARALEESQQCVAVGLRCYVHPPPRPPFH